MEERRMGHRRSSGEVRSYVRSSKPRFNWTEDLKLLFEEAMEVLGGTRKATPKKIRELIKCPNLQLSHIKSRLQMCRIRMEETERRSSVTCNSSEEQQQASVKREENAAEKVNHNGKNEPCNDNRFYYYWVPPPLSISCPSFKHQSQPFFPQSDQRPLKRLRPEAELTAASGIQFYLNYFGHRQQRSAVMPQCSAAYIFREQHSDDPKKKEVAKAEHDIKASLFEVEEEEDFQLSLSLSSKSHNKMNLDLAL